MMMMMMLRTMLKRARPGRQGCGSPGSERLAVHGGRWARPRENLLAEQKQPPRRLVGAEPGVARRGLRASRGRGRHLRLRAAGSPGRLAWLLLLRKRAPPPPARRLRLGEVARKPSDDCRNSCVLGQPRNLGCRHTPLIAKDATVPANKHMCRRSGGRGTNQNSSEEISPLCRPTGARSKPLA